MDRIEWIDTAKGIGILCVIMGHTAMTPTIHALIYAFHLPLFFMLSGVFLFRTKRDFKHDIWHKVKTLMIPYLIFNLVYFSYYFLAKDIFRIFLNVGSVIDFQLLLKCLYAIVIGDRGIASLMWFLPCLFISEALLLILYKRCKNLSVLVILCAFAGCLVNYFVGTPLPMSLDNVLIASSFIALGGLINLNEQKNYPILLYIGVLFIFIAFFILNYELLGEQGIDMFSCRYGNYLYFYVASISAIFIIVSIIRRFPRSRFFLFMGKNSLLIYCTHSIFLDTANSVVRYLDLPDSYVLLRSLIIIAFVCMCSYPTAYVINKYCPWMLGRFK